MHIRRDAAKIVKGRGEYECRAEPCLLGREIEPGEVHVSVHDSAPTGPGAHHLRHNHFSVRYHLRCFSESRTTDRHTTMLSHEIRELEGYDRHRVAVDTLLDDTP